MKSECVALLLVLSMLAGVLPARIWYVDDDAPGDPLPFSSTVSDPREDGSAEHPFDDIQKAIDAAADGDTIIVAPGQYLSRDPWAYAELRFKGKSLRLVGSAPTDFTTIEQTILCGVVIFDGTEDPNCLLQGFQIRNHGYGGILGNKTRASVSHCIIRDNGPCGATVLKDVHGRVANCLIVENASFHDCGVWPVVTGCTELVNCTIANNLSGLEVTNDGLPAGSQVTVRNCIVWGNQSAYQLLQRWNSVLPSTLLTEYCLVGPAPSTSTGGAAAPATRGGSSTRPYGDPSFVQVGLWGQAAGPPPVARGGPITMVKKVVAAGDYRLRTEGWRWSPQLIHGSHWYFDTVTSVAIDAGDPLDGLGEELERVPHDPEGQWGINRAIDLGAYGGTTQASLAPTRGEPPGVGAVDLRDYWPLNQGNRWYVHDPQATVREAPAPSAPASRSGSPTTARELRVSNVATRPDNKVYVSLVTANAPAWVASVRCYYVDRTLYMTQDIVPNDPPPGPPKNIQAQYPQYPVIDAVIQAPYDPFVRTAPQYYSVRVTRGSLAQVLAGTSLDPALFLAGAWPDVLALVVEYADGTLGDPVAIFARGFGPLLIAGQPIERAFVAGRNFADTPGGTGASPATRR